MSTPLLADAEWVADHLDDPGVRLVDVREPWEYDSIGQLPGAVNIPFDSYRDETAADPGMLPGADAFGALLSEAGISPDDTLVAYDDTHGVFAARFVLTALVYGHADVRLLNGDFSAWRRTYQVTTEPPTVSPTQYELDGLVDDAPLVDQRAVEAAIEAGETTLLDTREQWEYDEGHLPGAIRLDWMELVDEASRNIRTADEIKTLLDEREIPTDREQPIILYCNTARRLSHTFVVLKSIGFTEVSVYEGSLTDWDRTGQSDTTA